MENNYGVCKFCGAKNVKNPNTGKIFCSEKCWLKSEQKPVPAPVRDTEKLTDKDRAFGQAKGAAFNKSVDVIIAAYNKGEVNFEQIPEFVEKLFQEFVKINAEN